VKHFQLPKFLSDIDYSLLAIMIALIGIGVLSIASAGIDAEGIRFSTEYLKQLVWAATGTILVIAAMGLDISRLKDYTAFAYAALLLVLVYTRFAGRVVNGARSWIGVGTYGIQPSEFAKIATILFLARYLDASEHRSSAAFGICQDRYHTLSCALSGCLRTQEQCPSSYRKRRHHKPTCPAHPLPA